MITLNDYKEPTSGNNPYLVKGFIDNKIPTEDEFRKALDDKLEKGLIDKELHAKAIDQLDSLMKAKGKEGSRGGHVIGHTKSGKPVYAGKKASEYKNFTSEEHMEAYKHHVNEANNHSLSAPTDLPNKKSYHESMFNHHNEIASSHGAEASAKYDKSLSSDEKKILADQKKKQIEHHDKMHNFHKEMSEYAKNKYKTDKLEGVKHPTELIEEQNRHHQLAQHHQSEKERLEKE